MCIALYNGHRGAARAAGSHSDEAARRARRQTGSGHREPAGAVPDVRARTCRPATSRGEGERERERAKPGGFACSAAAVASSARLLEVAPLARRGAFGLSDQDSSRAVVAFQSRVASICGKHVVLQGPGAAATGAAMLLSQPDSCVRAVRSIAASQDHTRLAVIEDLGDADRITVLGDTLLPTDCIAPQRPAVQVSTMRTTGACAERRVKHARNAGRLRRATWLTRAGPPLGRRLECRRALPGWCHAA